MFGVSITERGHEILKAHLQKGDVAVDCTAGHGMDTLFLAERTGVEGKVHAFEIQQEAISELREKMNPYPQVEIHSTSNVYLEEYVRSANVIMYNLGFLPGGNPELTTRTETTIQSLDSACRIVVPRGIISVVAYPGHPEGAKEAVAVEEFLRKLPSATFEVLTIRQTNRSPRTPVQHFIYRNR
ncbi:MAG: class I SAM-dependent methyltransferase [Eubacteriales bacterium]|nr:class I SAM-dependent methyltransferase [Eubacteriales bacterium]